MLFGTPIIRSLFIVGAFMFFSFGLWNVLLLPFSLQVLGATEFQYGLQEGLTSVGFVVGSFFMARFSSMLPEPAWIVVSMIGDGHLRRPVRAVDPDRRRDRAGHALGLLPAAVVGRRARCCSSATRRARCAAGCSRRSTSCATSSSCSGWPAPAWPTSSTSGCSSWRVVAPVRVGRVHARRPRPRRLDLGRGIRPAARSRPRRRPSGRPMARPATIADFDRLAGRLGAFSRLSPDQRAAFVRAATVARRHRAARGSSSTATPRRPRTSSSTARRRRASRSTTATRACRR